MATIKRKSEKTFDVLVYLLVTVICLICLYPMLYVLFASFSNGYRIYSHVGPIWYPLGFSLDGYRVVLSNPDVWTGYKNTLIYVVFGTVFSMVMTIIGAFVLSRRGYKLKKFFTMFLVLTMYLHGGMIPTFMVVRTLGILNTYIAIIIVGAVGTWNMIIMKTSFQAIPQGLEEAATIDGANDLQVLFHIILPTSKAKRTAAPILFF